MASRLEVSHETIKDILEQTIKAGRRIGKFPKFDRLGGHIAGEAQLSRSGKYARLEDLDAKTLKSLKAQVRKHDGVMIFATHPFFMTSASMRASDRYFEDEITAFKGEEGTYFKNIPKIVGSKDRPPMLVLDGTHMLSTSLDLQHLGTPKRNTFFLETPLTSAKPAIGWNRFHGILQDLGVEKAVVIGQLGRDVKKKRNVSSACVMQLATNLSKKGIPVELPEGHVLPSADGVMDERITKVKWKKHPWAKRKK